MKYIRTKDGIFKLADYLGIHNGKKYALMDDAKGNRITMCQEPEELYKTSDTIEELCDYFIYNEYNEDNSESGKLIFKKIFHEYEKEQLKSIMLDGGGNIKLGILTEKGLIYVAKMNDKGELELL